jgi:transforming growth factor-beta-induced protein
MKAILRKQLAVLAISSLTVASGVFAATSVQAQEEPSEASAERSELSMSPAGKNVVQKLAKTGQYSTLITAVTQAGLADTLATTQGITVFAPTDAAFAKIPPADLQALIADKEKLKSVLTYHVSPRRLRESQLAQRGNAPTLYGANIAVTGTPEDLVLNGNVSLTLGDIRATNGIIHSIDTVLTPPALPKDVVATAIAAGSFSTLVTAVQAAGLEQTLRTTQNITVFAPTDAAFAKIPKATLDAILADKALLTKILTYHVSGRVITAEQILNAGSGTIRTLAGERIRFVAKDGKVVLNETVMVTATNIKASNGIIHVLDAVLIPPSVANAPTTTVSPTSSTTSTVPPTTTAAPATTVAPIPTTVPPTTVPPTMPPTTVPVTTAVPTTVAPIPTTTKPIVPVGAKDIVDTAIGAGGFTTLVAAVQAAGLESTLRTAKGITVFAPTDAAFAKLGDATIKALLADPKALGTILKYHVLPTTLTSKQIVDQHFGVVKTLQGQSIFYHVRNGAIILNNQVTVTVRDIPASNGIIHVIDTVLTVPGAQATSSASSGSASSLATSSSTSKSASAEVSSTVTGNGFASATSSSSSTGTAASAGGTPKP